MTRAKARRARAEYDARWNPPAPAPLVQWVDIVEFGRVIGQVDLKSGMRLLSDYTAGEMRKARRLEQRFGTR